MKSYEFAKKKLMTPGPVPLPESVKSAFSDFDCHHRTVDFTEVLERVFSDLKKVFQTKNHCFILASTGTGALEAAMVNCAGTKKPVLTLNAGKFGQRWKKIADAYKVPTTQLDFDWGRDIDLDVVRKALKAKPYHAVAWQACETSTGAQFPTQELAQLCQENNVLSIVDGITALGAYSLPMDEWGIDVLIGGSQKAFMLPTGLSFISLSARAEAFESDLPSYYFDLKAEKKSNLDGKTRWSTPTHFVLALDRVLDQVLNHIGLSEHFASIEEKARTFRDAVGLPLFPQTPSPSLTCLALPEGVSGNRVKAQVYQDGFTIMGGQDQLNDRVLRVGHMGAMSLDDLTRTAHSIKKFI